MTSNTLSTPTPAVTAFHRALRQIEQRRSALAVIPAPIVRTQRPRTFVEEIADICYVIATAVAVLAVVTLLILFLLSALTLEVSRAARRYWYEHNLTQRGLAALLMTGVYGAARVVNLYPAARAAVSELNGQLIESYRPAFTVTVQFCIRLPGYLDQLLALAFQLPVA